MEWFLATDSAGWSGRFGHTVVTFDNKIWILGGNDGEFRNDVWYSSGLEINEEKNEKKI